MTNEPFPQTPTICCVCAGAHHPWDCERARRFVSEVTSGSITPHDASEQQRQLRREHLLDEAAVILRALVSDIDREDREVVRLACLRGKRRVNARMGP